MMKGFLNRLFGSNKAKSEQQIVSDFIEQFIQIAGFDLSFEIQNSEEFVYKIELYGKDENLILENNANLLDALEFYLKRAIQNKFPEQKISIILDTSDFRERFTQNLVDIAEKHKRDALERKRPVYLRPLPPKERKVIHQYFAQDTFVKSVSIGNSYKKKIKIYPING